MVRTPKISDGSLKKNSPVPKKVDQILSKTLKSGGCASCFIICKNSLTGRRIKIPVNASSTQNSKAIISFALKNIAIIKIKIMSIFNFMKVKIFLGIAHVLNGGIISCMPKKKKRDAQKNKQHKKTRKGFKRIHG